MIIDFVVRPPYKSLLDSLLFRRTPPSPAPSRPSLRHHLVPSRDQRCLDRFFQEMDAAGLDRVVVQGLNAKPGVGQADNDDIAELVQKYPDRFIGLGAVGVDSVPQAVDEVVRCQEQLGLLGICMTPSWQEQPFYPDDAALFPIYEKCQQMGMLCSFISSVFTGPDLSYGHPLHLQRVALRFPELNVVVCHAGWPYIAPMLGIAMQCQNIYLAPDFYSYVPDMPMANQLVRAANSYLRYRLLYSSSYPTWPLGESLQEFKKLPWRAEILDDVLGNNAAQLLGL